MPVSAGQPLGVNIPTTLRLNNHDFVGWFDSLIGGVEYHRNTPINFSVTLFARWRPRVNSVNITFNPNGGTPTPMARSLSSSTQAIGTLPVVARANHTFAGWWTAQTGGTQVNASSMFTTHTTLFARWTPNPSTFVVTFNAIGGISTERSRNVPRGHAIGTLPTAAWTGYLFRGWFTSQMGGTQITPNTVINNNLTVFAQWDNIPTVNVTLNPNNGEPSVTHNLPIGSTLRGILTEPKRTGHRFLGWFTSPVPFGEVENIQAFSSVATSVGMEISDTTQFHSDTNGGAGWETTDIPNVTTITNIENGENSEVVRWRDLHMSWTPVDNAHYIIDICDVTMDSDVITQRELTETSFTMQQHQLEAGHMYRVRVRAVTPNSRPSDWSVRLFEVGINHPLRALMTADVNAFRSHDQYFNEWELPTGHISPPDSVIYFSGGASSGTNPHGTANILGTNRTIRYWIYIEEPGTNGRLIGVPILDNLSDNGGLDTGRWSNVQAVMGGTAAQRFSEFTVPGTTGTATMRTVLINTIQGALTAIINEIPDFRVIYNGSVGDRTGRRSVNHPNGVAIDINSGHNDGIDDYRNQQRLIPGINSSQPYWISLDVERVLNRYGWQAGYRWDGPAVEGFFHWSVSGT